MMKRRMQRAAAQHTDIVFQPALMPLEAAMLPAKDTRPYGTLRMAMSRYAWDERGREDQRQKIWVR